MISQKKIKTSPVRAGSCHKSQEKSQKGKPRKKDRELWDCTTPRERKLFLGLCGIIWRLSPSKSNSLGQRGSESRTRGLPPCTFPWSQPRAGGAGGTDRAQGWQLLQRKPKIRQSLPLHTPGGLSKQEPAWPRGWGRSQLGFARLHPGICHSSLHKWPFPPLCCLCTGL